MVDFPKSKIIPIKGGLSGCDGDVSIEIFLKPFELELDENSEQVETSIRLDTIEIPVAPTAIEGKTFEFSVNPEPGYIDGSVYFFSVHNPIDVTKITFGKIENGYLPIELECQWLLEFENTGFKNFESQVKTQIEL